MWLNCFQSQATPQRAAAAQLLVPEAPINSLRMMVWQAGVWPPMGTAGYMLTSPLQLSYGCAHPVHVTWRDSAWFGTPWGMTQFHSWVLEHYLPQTFGNGMMTAGIQMKDAEGTFEHLGAKNAKPEHCKNMKGSPKIQDKLNCFPEVISFFFSFALFLLFLIAQYFYSLR